MSWHDLLTIDPICVEVSLHHVTAHWPLATVFTCSLYFLTLLRRYLQITLNGWYQKLNPSWIGNENCVLELWFNLLQWFYLIIKFKMFISFSAFLDIIFSVSGYFIPTSWGRPSPISLCKRLHTILPCSCGCGSPTFPISLSRWHR